MLGENGGEWRVNQLLFADDTALVAGSEEDLKSLVEEFGRVCARRILRMNVGKNKVCCVMGIRIWGVGENQGVTRE